MVASLEMWWLTFGTINVVFFSVTAAWLKLHQIRHPSLFRTLQRKLAYSTAAPPCDDTQQLDAQVEVQHVRKYYQYAQVRSARQLGTLTQSTQTQHATNFQRQLLRRLPNLDDNTEVARWPPHLEAKAQMILAHAKVARALCGFAEQSAIARAEALGDTGQQSCLQAKDDLASSSRPVVAAEMQTAQPAISPQTSFIPSEYPAATKMGFECMLQKRPLGPGFRQPPSLGSEIVHLGSAQPQGPDCKKSFGSALQPLPEPCPSDSHVALQPKLHSQPVLAPPPQTVVSLHSQAVLTPPQVPQPEPFKSRAKRRKRMHCFSSPSVAN